MWFVLGAYPAVLRGYSDSTIRNYFWWWLGDLEIKQRLVHARQTPYPLYYLASPQQSVPFFLSIPLYLSFGVNLELNKEAGDGRRGQIFDIVIYGVHLLGFDF